MNPLDFIELFRPDSPSGQVVTVAIFTLFGISVLAVLRNLTALYHESSHLAAAKAAYGEAGDMDIEALFEALMKAVPPSMTRRRVELLYRTRQLHALATDLLDRVDKIENVSTYRFPRFSLSVMLILGLLGTVIGLALSVRGILPTIQSGGADISVDALLGALALALGGLETAFSTTLTGLGCTLALASIVLVNQWLEARFRGSLELFMTHDIMPRILLSSEDEARSQYVQAVESSARKIGEAAKELANSREGIRSIVDGLVDATRAVEARTVDLFNFAQTFRDGVSGLDGFVVTHAEKLEHTYRKIDGVLREIQENQVTDKIIGQIVDRSVSRAMEETNRNAGEIRKAFKADLEEVTQGHKDFVKAVDATRKAIDGIGTRMAESLGEGIDRSFGEIIQRFEEGLEKARVQEEVIRMLNAEVVQAFREHLDRATASQEATQERMQELVTVSRQLIAGSPRRPSPRSRDTAR